MGFQLFGRHRFPHQVVWRENCSGHSPSTPTITEGDHSGPASGKTGWHLAPSPAQRPGLKAPQHCVTLSQPQGPVHSVPFAQAGRDMGSGQRLASLQAAAPTPRLRQAPSGVPGPGLPSRLHGTAAPLL